MNHTPLKVTPEQRANLITLAKGLMGLYGPLKAQFMMYVFCSYGNEKKEFCGTVGCAVGQGPQFGIEKKKNEHWYTYAKRQFIGRRQIYYCLLFDQKWGAVDNTPIGAAQRIIYLLKNGVPDTTEVPLSRKYFMTLYSHLTLADLEGVEG